MPRTPRDLRGLGGAVGLATVTAALAGLAVLLTARFGFPQLPDLARSNGGAYDFGIFYRSTVALWTGGDVYPSGQPNFAPPVTMVVLGPLALLQATTAYRAFVVVSVAALLAALAWLGGTVRVHPGSAVVATGVLLVSPAMVDTLAQGQIYPLLTTGLRLFMPGRDLPPLLDAPVLSWAIALAAVAVLVLSLARPRRNDTDLWAITAACPRDAAGARDTARPLGRPVPDRWGGRRGRAGEVEPGDADQSRVSTASALETS